MHRDHADAYSIKKNGFWKRNKLIVAAKNKDVQRMLLHVLKSAVYSSLDSANIPCIPHEKLL